MIWTSAHGRKHQVQLWGSRYSNSEQPQEADSHRPVPLCWTGEAWFIVAEAVIYSTENVTPLQCIHTVNTSCDQRYSTIIRSDLSVSQVSLLQGQILQYFSPFPTCSSEHCLPECNVELLVSVSLLHIFVVQIFYYINSKKSFQWKQ